MNRTQRACAATFVTLALSTSGIIAPSLAFATEETSKDQPTYTIDAYQAGEIVIPSASSKKNRGSLSELGSEIQAASIENEDDAMLDLSIASKGGLAASSNKFVDISWEKAAEGRTYQIFRDDQLIETTTDGSFRDTSARPGITYNYRVETLEPKDGSKLQDTEISIRGFEVHVPATTDILKEVRAQNERIATRAANQSTTVAYRTFIPQAKIDAPVLNVLDKPCEYGAPNQFGGDNRGYTSSLVSSRTSVGATLNWVSGSFNYSATNGETTVYNKNGTKLASRTASTNDMWVKQLARTSSNADLRFSVKSGNPFCVGNSIQGAFTITISKNGAYAMNSGTHRQMPNHEVYIMGSSTWAWKTVYQRRYASEYCLVSMLCAEATFLGSGSY